MLVDPARAEQALPKGGEVRNALKKAWRLYAFEDCFYKKKSPPSMIWEKPMIWLWLTMGPKIFLLFQKKFGAHKLWIPKFGNVFPCSDCPFRALHLQKLRKEKGNVAQIAERFALSRKHVYALLNERS